MKQVQWLEITLLWQFLNQSYFREMRLKKVTTGGTKSF